MYYFANFFALNQVVYFPDVFFKLIDFRRNGVNLNDIVVDLIKPPAGQYEKMSLLGVFAFHSINKLIFGVVDLQLLELLGPTAAIQHRPFNNFAHIIILIVDPYLRPVARH
jgi:hypothetical protein